MKVPCAMANMAEIALERRSTVKVKVGGEASTGDSHHAIPHSVIHALSMAALPTIAMKWPHWWRALVRV